jgi:hypothetical protein
MSMPPSNWSPSYSWLFGINVLGTKYSGYKYTSKQQLSSPPAFPRDLEKINDYAPAARWNYDILHPAVKKESEIVGDIKAM